MERKKARKKMIIMFGAINKNILKLNWHIMVDTIWWKQIVKPLRKKKPIYYHGTQLDISATAATLSTNQPF